MSFQEELIRAMDAAGKREPIVVCDFDGTLTTADSDVTMNAMAKYLGYESPFAKARDELYRTYAPQLAEAPDGEKETLERKWWNGQMNLFLRYPVAPESFTEALGKLDFRLRPEAEELLRFCEEKDIAVFIVSAGLGNLIIPILAYSGHLSGNLRVLSNFVRYEDGKAVSYTAPVTPSNKGIHLRMELDDFDDYYAVVFGNREEDLTLLPPEDSMAIRVE